MPESETYLFKNCVEFVPVSRFRKEIPANVRGVYVLYNSPDGEEMNVVYIGMSRGKKLEWGPELEIMPGRKLAIGPISPYMRSGII